VKKNTQIFLVVVGVVTWFSPVQSAADLALFFQVRQRRRPAAQMVVAKPDFLKCVRAYQILIENAERFARIDLDLSDFEKERTQ